MKFVVIILLLGCKSDHHLISDNYVINKGVAMQTNHQTLAKGVEALCSGIFMA